MVRGALFRCLGAAVAAAAIVGYQVACQAQKFEPQPQGSLESLARRAQGALESWWRRARGEADGVVQGVVRGFRQQEQDVLRTATEQLGDLGVNVDLTEAGDNVGYDLSGCAGVTRERYTRLLAQLRRRVQRCWGWESDEVAALVQAVEDLILAGDRLPGLLRTNMNRCLQRGRPPAQRGRWRPRGTPRAAAAASPSPFRVLRCTADSVNLTWTYVTAVPREVGRAARRTATILGSSREDWAACAGGVVRQCAGSAMQALRDLGACVVERVSDQSWQQVNRAWADPRR
ncbi:hypothetical protein ONE63_002024 [Megalurothrips usitatus]|uniref:Uncharacterized protein n=1 Tax=Megalurothrips usitatus TaxID=439358 RepID=A0AAV7XE75_9NEOP|nr:hypothetical protein ONE63_002024 [Megalurothrips usitatus]